MSKRIKSRRDKSKLLTPEERQVRKFKKMFGEENLGLSYLISPWFMSADCFGAMPSRQQSQFWSNRDQPRRIVRAARMTGKTHAIAVEALYRAITEKDARILIYSPMRAMTQEVFSRIRQAMPEEAQQTICRDVSYPYLQIQFDNGSSIRGASSSLGLRGQQDISCIYVDEATYVTDPEMSAILPALQSFPDAKIALLGTPRSYYDSQSTFFHRIYEDAPDEQKMHWSALENSVRGPIALDSRDSYTTEDWTTEVLGEWVSNA